MLTENDLRARKLPELKDLGDSLSIPKAKYMKKEELVAAILTVTGKEAPKQETSSDKVPSAKPERPQKTKSEQNNDEQNQRRERNPKHKNNITTAITITNVIADARKSFTLKAL